MLSVLWFHSNLIVAQECIHEYEEFMSCSDIHQLVYPREWVAIFEACLVEICVVDTHSPVSIMLLNMDYIRQLPRILYLGYESNVDQVVCLVVDCILSIWGEFSWPLLHRMYLGVDVEVILHDL